MVASVACFYETASVPALFKGDTLDRPSPSFPRRRNLYYGNDFFAVIQLDELHSMGDLELRGECCIGRATRKQGVGTRLNNPLVVASPYRKIALLHMKFLAF